MPNEWTRPEHAEAYLARKDAIAHRAEGEATLLSEVPARSMRVLDLGCGDGHLLALVLAHCPTATGVGLDFSNRMLDQAQKRFAGDPRVQLIDVETQLRWLREVGFVEVDCHWKWRELALIVGCKE
jgi:tRNA (cmo5U34)-methyltransferase